jgi:hypothetical protein
MPISRIPGAGIDTGSSGVAQSNLATGVAGTGPAFSAYISATQSISAATNTKVQFNAENFDTASCFDSSTNYRFTPNVSGYYFVQSAIFFNASNGNSITSLFKNGANIAELARLNISSGAQTPSGSYLVYMNGTTDYLEVYAYATNATTIGNSGAPFAYFNGFLARAA